MIFLSVLVVLMVFGIGATLLGMWGDATKRDWASEAGGTLFWFAVGGVQSLGVYAFFAYALPSLMGGA